MGQEAWAITFGLGCAITWGAADFSGGMATKKGNVYGVVLFSQMIGLFFLLGLLGTIGDEFPGLRPILVGGLGGLSGSLGLICLYKSLAKSPMALVAPLSAIVTAMLPVVVAASLHGLPPTIQLVGFGLAMVSIWLVSWTRETLNIKATDLVLPVLAGLGFGGFFICIHFACQEGFLWPLLGAKIVGLSVLGCVLGYKTREQGLGRPPWKWILLAGLLDVAGNGFYVMASQAGRLDLAAVLSSLYPASTVLLAWWILHERVNWSQWAGIGATLGALLLISLG